MKVRLLVDRPLPGGRSMPRGSVVDLPDEDAVALCTTGFAVAVPPGSLVDELLVTPIDPPRE